MLYGDQKPFNTLQTVQTTEGDTWRSVEPKPVDIANEKMENTDRVYSDDMHRSTASIDNTSMKVRNI